MFMQMADHSRYRNRMLSVPKEIMDFKDDILLELTKDEIQELISLYAFHKEELPHIYSFLHVCMKSKETNEMQHFVSIFSPKDCWKEDGTFVASMPYYGHHIVLHSLDQSGKNLIHCLTHTRRFTVLPGLVTTLYCVHEFFYEKVQRVFKEVQGHEITDADTLYMWRLKKEKAMIFDIRPPPEVYIKEIEEKDIHAINSIWPHRYPDSEKKHLDCLKLRKGFGVYLKSNDELVSWVLPSCLGQFTALQTAEGYKMKGYGSLVAMKMAKYLAELGFDSFGTVFIGNLASEVLLEKLGFEKTYKCQYIGLQNSTSKIRCLQDTAKDC